jgi:RNA polymerase sigma-70 factor (ECF subfamily)
MLAGVIFGWGFEISLLENTSFSAPLIRAHGGRRDRAALLAREAQSHTAALYTELGGEFLSYAVSVARDEEVARDALQEVFMRYFVALCGGEGIRSPRAWIYKVLHNYLMDRMKDPRSSESSLNTAAVCSQDIEAECLRDEVMALVRTSLTEREYACIRLRTEGLGYEEIATELRVKSGAVGAVISRAMHKLRKAIASPGGKK